MRVSTPPADAGYTYSAVEPTAAGVGINWLAVSSVRRWVGAVAQRQCISQSALKRLPDGETGIRKTWIRFLQRSFRRQHSQVLADNPAIEVASDVPPFKFTQWDGKVLQLDGRRGRAARLASHAGAEFRCVVSTRDQRRPVGRHHIVVVGAIGVGSEI